MKHTIITVELHDPSPTSNKTHMAICKEKVPEAVRAGAMHSLLGGPAEYALKMSPFPPVYGAGAEDARQRMCMALSDHYSHLSELFKGYEETEMGICCNCHRIRGNEEVE
jgi:hypothetical protein